MRFLADMNISPLTVKALAADGMDIVRVSDLLQTTASDESILGLARQQGRTVITQDMDFSALLALGGYDQPSLVTLRLLNTDPDVVPKDSGRCCRRLRAPCARDVPLRWRTMLCEYVNCRFDRCAERPSARE